ncbi:MAG: tetratricopeptide repeat protein [Methanothrix sp.]
MAKETLKSILGEKLKLCESEPEKLFLVAANKLGYITSFIPQYELSGYRLDFAIPNRKIAIEIDGYNFHKTKEQMNYDYKREQSLERLGWRVFRFTGSQVFKNSEKCVHHVIGCINEDAKCKKDISKTERIQRLYQIAKGVDWIKSEAGEIEDKSLQINVLDTSALTDKGLMLINAGNYEEAITTFIKVIEINPLYVWSYINLGIALSFSGRHYEAIENFNKALEREPFDVDALTNKGIVLGELGRYDNAITLFDAALKIRPLHTNALISKGEALKELNRFREAVICYDEALKDRPNFPSRAPIWKGKGDVYFAQDDYDAAINCYDKANTLDPSLIDSWYNKGKAFYKLDKLDESIKCFDKVTEIDDCCAKGWFLKSKALRKKGIFDEAETAFKKAKRMIKK